MKPNIIISAGGTGGHIFPALAVAHELSERYNIIWVGGKSGLENQIVPKHGYPLKTVSVGGVRNKGIMRKLMLPFVMFRALLQSLIIIIRYNPKVIVGFGGYATFPICLMGRLINKPIVIHEQNSVAGLTNKIIAKFAKKVLTAFPNVLPAKNTVLVGNPVRKEIIKLTKVNVSHESLEHKQSDPSKLKILVIGGSLGAKALNDNVPLAVTQIREHIESVYHQVGRGELDLVSEVYKQHNVNAKVVSFIDDMASAYLDADVVICRAGASTVAEVAAVGITAIFIPYPYAVDDHQTTNAAYLAKNEAAYLIPQKNLNPDDLAKLLASLTPEKTREMAIKARGMGIEDATEQICQQIEKVIIR